MKINYLRQLGDTLAISGDEGRDKLRKASVSGTYTYPEISEWENPFHGNMIHCMLNI